jgi:hypothetical protein
VGVGALSLDFVSFDSMVPSLLVDDLANLREGDGDGEREVGVCCTCGEGVEETDSDGDCTTSLAAVVCIGVRKLDWGPVVSVPKLRSDAATLPALRLVLERPVCSISPASLASDPRDAGRDTTFCGGIIVALLSFQRFGPSLLHNTP